MPEMEVHRPVLVPAPKGAGEDGASEAAAFLAALGCTSSVHPAPVLHRSIDSNAIFLRGFRVFSTE